MVFYLLVKVFSARPLHCDVTVFPHKLQDLVVGLPTPRAFPFLLMLPLASSDIPEDPARSSDHVLLDGIPPSPPHRGSSTDLRAFPPPFVYLLMYLYKYGLVESYFIPSYHHFVAQIAPDLATEGSCKLVYLSF